MDTKRKVKTYCERLCHALSASVSSRSLALKTKAAGSDSWVDTILMGRSGRTSG